MKKVDTSNIILGTRRMGFNKAVLDHLQESFSDIVSDVMIGILADAAGVTVIRGIVNSGSDADYDISEGTVFYNGECFEVDAFEDTATGGDVPVLQLETTYRAGDPIKYSDNNEFNTNAIRKLKWEFGATGSGIVDFDDLQGNLKDSVAGKLSSANGAVGNANLGALSVTTAKIAASAVTSAKVDESVFVKGNGITTDCNTFAASTIQLVNGSAANAPGSGAKTFRVESIEGTAHGDVDQTALQLTGTGAGGWYYRYFTLLPSPGWSGWTLINDPAA